MAGRAPFGRNFPKVGTCWPCTDFGQQCVRGIAESSLKLKQTFTGQFWGDSIQSARPISTLTRSGGQGSWDSAALQGLPCSPILAVGVPQGMSHNQNPWLGKSIGRSVAAGKSALWLFLGITTCSEHQQPTPPSPHIPQHMPPLFARY